MKGTGELRSAAARAAERGGARLNFLLVMVVIGALIYVGVQYVPAAYRAWAFEKFMQQTVDTAAAMNKPNAWVEQQLRQSLEEYDMPEDATVEVRQDGKRVVATVRYTQPISLLVAEYEYEFDVTTRSVSLTGGF